MVLFAGLSFAVGLSLGMVIVLAVVVIKNN